MTSAEVTDGLRGPPAPSAGTTVRFLPEPALVAPSHPTAGQLAAFPHLRVTNRSDRQR